MDISLQSSTSFKIKTKTANIEIGSSIKLTNIQTEVVKEITGPGEYEIMGISIMGYKNNIFVYEFEKLRLCSVGSLETQLSDDLVNEIGDVDVLMIANGSKIADDLISKIEPYFVVVPIENFFKDSGIASENLAKFTLKEEDIIEDQNTKVIVLEKK
ncbi:MAG TPA: MBL fold metallo-hydrolase [Patescibacteria group bacterium]|nr:MBL fold metallo-hydrolase [Patescibacteria group bacterium]